MQMSHTTKSLGFTFFSPYLEAHAGGLQQFKVYITLCVYISMSVHSICLTILAGLPTTTTLSGTSLVTTAAAPTVTPFPIVTPGQTVAPAPIQQSAPIEMDAAHSRPFIPLRSSGLIGC